MRVRAVGLRDAGAYQYSLNLHPLPRFIRMLLINMKRPSFILLFILSAALGYGATATPTLVQRSSGSSTYAGVSGTNNPGTYFASLPSPTQAGNCIVLPMTAASGLIITVSDDQSNSYSSFTETDTTNSQIIAIFYALNVAANTRMISVMVSGTDQSYVAVHPLVFDNVAAVGALDGAAGNFRTNTSVTTGSVTPSQTGDLVVQAVFMSGAVTATSFTAGSQSNISWQLATADIWDGFATQWGVYNSTSPLTPMMAVTASNVGYVSAVIFLKASASAQGSDLPAGLGIRGILHQALSSYSGGNNGGLSSPVTIQMPIYGNEAVMAISAGAGSLSQIADSNSNSWNCNAPYNGAATTTTEFCYPNPGSTFSTSMTATLTLNPPGKDYNVLIYDLKGAPASGTFYDSTSLGTMYGDQTINTATLTGATATPSTSIGIIISMIGQDFNTANSTPTSGCLIDSFVENNDLISGPSNLDGNNGWAHCPYSSTVTVTPVFGFLSNTLPQGTWASMAAAFEAAATPAVMTSPTPGSTLSGSSVTFDWTPGAGASAYWLVVGSTAGGDDYYSSGNLGDVLTATVNGLPTNGSTLYVTLYSLIGGAWVPNAYTYTALTAAASSAIITMPTPGSTLSGSTVTFGWTAGAGASAYWLAVGSTTGGDNYYSSGNLVDVLTATVNGLPTNGSTLYVTLYSLIGGAWVPNAYTYTALTAAAAGGIITMPTPGSTLSGSSVTFGWTAGAGASAYWLVVGSTPGGANYYSSELSGLTATVNGLPTDGSTVYVTLYALIGGSWVPYTYTYTAFSGAAGGVITTPTPGSTLSGSSMTFGWTAGAGVSAYWLVVGSTAGGTNYYSSEVSGLTATVNGLPTDGSTVYVTLYALIGGTWVPNSYTYTAFNGAASGVITTPVPGSTLSGSSVAFGWTAGAGASAYWLVVGSTAGGDDYYSSGNLGDVLTATVNGLPANGSTIYVTLFSDVGGQWLNNAYAYVSGPLQLPSQAQVLGTIETVTATGLKRLTSPAIWRPMMPPDKRIT